MAERTTTKKGARGAALRAYNARRQRLKEENEQEDNVQEALAAEQQQKTVAEALGQPEDEIVTAITALKLRIAKDLEAIAEQRVVEFRKLSEIEKAVAAEAKRLQELYEIVPSAETLVALVKTQEEERASFSREMEQTKAAFDVEMAEARSRWDRERSAAEDDLKERRIRLERERKQEEEDHAYKTAKKRQAEADAYEQRKAAQERELAEKREAFEKEYGAREAALKAQEQELSELRAKTASFPAEIDKAVNETDMAVRERLEVEYKHQAAMLQKEIEGERKLHAQEVASLEGKIKEKDALITQLTRKADETGRQVQEIAVKAIDGASKLRVIREFPGEKDRGGDKG